MNETFELKETNDDFLGVECQNDPYTNDWHLRQLAHKYGLELIDLVATQHSEVSYTEKKGQEYEQVHSGHAYHRVKLFLPNVLIKVEACKRE